MADSGLYPEKYLNWFDKNGVGRPQFASHGVTDDNIRDHMTQIRPKVWRQEGNWVFGETDIGELRLNVGVHKKLNGTTEDGLPILVDTDKL